MVTPHLVHMLSQSSGTVEMRWCGHWYARNIFYREMARKKQFQPNVAPRRKSGDRTDTLLTHTHTVTDTPVTRCAFLWLLLSLQLLGGQVVQGFVQHGLHNARSSLPIPATHDHCMI